MENTNVKPTFTRAFAVFDESTGSWVRGTKLWTRLASIRSFLVHLKPLVRTGEIRREVNPYTGKVVEVPVYEPRYPDHYVVVEYELVEKRRWPLQDFMAGILPFTPENLEDVLKQVDGVTKRGPVILVNKDDLAEVQAVVNGVPVYTEPDVPKGMVLVKNGRKERKLRLRNN